MTDEQDKREQLADLLGSGQEAAGGVAMVETSAPPPPPSPTVLDTDRWTKRAGERLAQQWREMREGSADVAGEEEFAPDDDTAKAHTAKMCDPNVAADAIETLLAGQPEMAERPEDEHRAKWWQQLLNSPETTALRAHTVANASVAEIAASELASAYAAYAIEHPPKDDGDGQDGDGDGEEESPEESVARMRSTRAALAAATTAVDAAEAVGSGLGLGSQGDAGKLAEYTRKLRRSPNLAAIMRMAGRFTAKAMRLQRQRTDLSGMEITGVELSGDLARALPMEAALVAGVVPELETLALLRLAERRTLSYRRIRREPKAMGPIVVSIDESGSMHGERIAAAKGLALAIASIARAQKRPFLLVSWSDLPNAGINVVRGDAPTGEIVEWLEAFQNGGTNLKGPLWTLTTEAWPQEKWGAHADHIIITDGEVGIEGWLRDHYRSWSKSGNVRTFGIGIGIRRTDTLAEFCDGGVWALPSLDLDNAAVDIVLSIGPTFTTV